MTRSSPWLRRARPLAFACALAPMAGCLYTGEVPQVRPSEEAVNPSIVNERPPRYSRVALGPDGLLFEVWAVDDNTYDQEALTITWTLENLTGDLAAGSKILLRADDLPEPSTGETSLVLEVQVEDSTGKRDLDGIFWELTAQPNLGDL